MVQKVAISLDKRTVQNLDRWVKEGKYPNRSRALQAAVDLLTEREKRSRLARELSKLDPKKEQRMADEGLGDASWPAY
jgi:Arc/MetJ-type ribon-helix-helix transcriptional regulator